MFSRLTEIYSDELSYSDKRGIKDQLELFIIHVKRLEEFRSYQDLTA